MSNRNTLSKSQRNFAFGLSMLAIPFALAHAGGIERNLIGSADVPERWFPNSGIYSVVNFRVARFQDANGQFYAPNYAYVESLPTTMAQVLRPGMRSCALAAGLWTTWNTPDYMFPGAKSLLIPSPQQTTTVYSAASSYSPISVVPPAGSFPPPPARVFAPDGVNMINMYEPSATFGPIGGALPLAVAMVYLNPVTGEILESDIAVNTRTVDATGVPLYSFVEESNGLNRRFASSPVFPSATLVAPSLGYASLLGVLTHELGHAIGLAHSIVDCQASTSGHDYPTMNFVGVTDAPRSFSLSLPSPGPAFGYVTQDVVTTSTTFKGYLGQGQETLTLDDRSAVIEAYPGPQANTALGSIVGTVYQAPAIGGVGTIPAWGAHVMAFDLNDPSRRRVGRLTLRNGNFRIDGLPPGTYGLEVEPIDLGGYVPFGAQLPTLVAGNPFTMGFYSEMRGGQNGEVIAENGRHRIFTPIVVTAGSVATAQDFSVEAIPAGGSEPLTVTVTTQIGNLGVGTPPGGTPPAPFVVTGPTGHGAGIIDSNFPTTLTYQVTTGAGNAGRLAYLLTSEVRGRTDLVAPAGYTQLLAIDSVSPVVTPLLLDAAGAAIVTVPYSLSNDLDSQFAQVMWDDASAGTFLVSNIVECRAFFP